MKPVRILFVSLLLSCPGAAMAQETEAAKFLGQTAENGSLPIWSKPEGDARLELGKAARANERGVFLIGYPKKGFGTGWVISKKNRLLITNAHVADIMHDAGGKLLAIPSGSSDVYQVEKVWYHPGVRRFLKGNTTLSIRSTDPNEGDIDPHSPDLALLQLSANGPDLTVEFTPATPDEWASLFAQPVAITGFPGTDTTTWPALGDSAAMTYHEGVISRTTNFEMNAGAPPAERQFLQYTMATWGGFSGSPVFLPNGHIAGVHNSASFKQNSGTGESKSIPHGIRVDCVLELLVSLHFEVRVPFTIDASKINLDRWTRPDERSEKARADYAKAVALVAEADRLSSFQHQHDAAEEKCIEAIKLAPGYAWAWSVRSAAMSNFYFDNYRNLAPDKAKALLEKS
ncbi:MAG TPA: serine protease, partial [Gemmataceae bacterium]|nr:serine protease [Gemmataceae bacterium]